MSKEIIRGNFAGGIIKHGKVMFWERWDIRELAENLILFWNDAYDSDKLNEKLVLLLPTPIINLN